MAGIAMAGIAMARRYRVVGPGHRARGVIWPGRRAVAARPRIRPRWLVRLHRGTPAAPLIVGRLPVVVVPLGPSHTVRHQTTSDPELRLRPPVPPVYHGVASTLRELS